MNNTKIAVLFGNKKHHNYYIHNSLGLIESYRHLPKNFQTQFFAMTDVMNAYEKNNSLIWFVNTVKAMKFAINERYEPNVVFCVGSPNYDWDKVLTGNYKKFFIYDSYEEPKKFFEWDGVIVPTYEDLNFFPNAIVGAVYNNKIFKDTGRKKHFNIFYPQLVRNMDLFLDIQHDEETIGLNNVENIFYLSDISSQTVNDIMNQSNIVCLLEKDNDIELALSAMACGLPVVTVEDNKASFLNGVFVSLATCPAFLEALDEVRDIRVEADLSKYTTEAFAKKLRELL